MLSVIMIGKFQLEFTQDCTAEAVQVESELMVVRWGSDQDQLCPCSSCPARS